MHLVSIALSLVPAVFAADAAQEILNRPTPPAPGWKFLYNCNVTMGYRIDLGKTATTNFTRELLPIQGGLFEGMDGLSGMKIRRRARTVWASEKLKNSAGRVLAVGGEWSTYNTAGYFISDARYQLQTEDRGDISVSTRGNTVPGGFRHVHARFETGSPRYAWMNDILAVGIMQPTKMGYQIDMWQVVSPNYTYVG